jgi:LmbE family N-acetylglucosaminyl deacetylase
LELVATQALLIVAPHPDDAALSCAALLERIEAADILTVFAGAPNPPRQGWWDLRCGFASSGESVQARRDEESKAFAGTAHGLEFLELLDEQYATSPRPAEDADAIEDAIRKWAAGSPSATVALPAGAGWTPNWWRTLLGRIRPSRLAPRQPGPRPSNDHVYLRDAGLSALGEKRQIEILLYEELPYLFGGSAEEQARRAAQTVGRHAEPLVLQVDRERKARRLAAYTSQIPQISPPGSSLDEPLALPAVERYWRLVPA